MQKIYQTLHRQSPDQRMLRKMPIKSASGMQSKAHGAQKARYIKSIGEPLSTAQRSYAPVQSFKQCFLGPMSKSMPRPLSRLLSRKGFRVLAFGILLLLLLLSYWLGNQFKRDGPAPDSQPHVQARLLEPAQAVAGFNVSLQGTELPLVNLVDDWTFVLPGRLEMDLNRRLAQAWNQLALEPRIQSRMRVWLLDETEVALPEFIQYLYLSREERERASQVFPEGGLYLLNPKGQLWAVFDPAQSATSIAHDFQHLLDSVTP
jgi:hypothetical protein